MTLPTLVKNHQRTVYVTQLQKVVNELSQATEKAIEDNNAVSLAETPYNYNNADSASNFLNTYFKVVQICTSPRIPCLASEYKQLNGSVFNSFDLAENSPCALLTSGATICMYGGIDSDQRYADGEIKHGWITGYIDVNGSQGPNILGRDLFYFGLYSDGKVAESYNNSDSHADYCGEADTMYGIGCLSKIMVDGWKMDY